jgi:flagellar biosynthesis/type III secretory pathway ATPase
MNDLFLILIVAMGMRVTLFAACGVGRVGVLIFMLARQVSIFYGVLLALQVQDYLF